MPNYHLIRADQPITCNLECTITDFSKIKCNLSRYIRFKLSVIVSSSVFVLECLLSSHSTVLHVNGHYWHFSVILTHTHK